VLPPAPPFVPRRLLIGADLFATAGPDVAAALAPGVERARSSFAACGAAAVREVQVHGGDRDAWPAMFRILQGDEVRAYHAEWIDRYRPRFGPGIAERFRWTRTIDPADVAAMKLARETVAIHMDELLGDDALLCLPTAPSIAPQLDTPPAELEAFRARAFVLLAIAGLARLPQISLPIGTMLGCPVGLSLMAPRGRDRGLLQWVATHFD